MPEENAIKVLTQLLTDPGVKLLLTEQLATKVSHGAGDLLIQYLARVGIGSSDKSVKFGDNGAVLFRLVELLRSTNALAYLPADLHGEILTYAEGRQRAFTSSLTG